MPDCAACTICCSADLDCTAASCVAFLTDGVNRVLVADAPAGAQPATLLEFNF